MDFTDVKPQMLIKIKEEESCTDCNTEMDNTAYTEIKTEYSHCDCVIKRELEKSSTLDKIEPVIEHNFQKEEKAFKDGCYLTSEVANCACNNYTAQLQTVVEQFELKQPSHISHEIKTEIPFYFTDSMNLKKEIDHETSHSRPTEVNAHNNQLDVSKTIKTETLNEYYFKQTSLEGHQIKHERNNSQHTQLNTSNKYERIDIESDTNSMQVLTTSNTDLETTSVCQDAVFSHNVNDLSESSESPETTNARILEILDQCHSYGVQSNMSVNGQRKYTCPECDKQFSKRCNLKQHIQSIHEKVKYTCPECGKQFSGKVHLKRHIQSIHEQVKYTCTECDKQFSQKSHLKIHIQSIHEQMKHTCTECGKQFSRKSVLKQHIQSVHALNVVSNLHKRAV